MPCVGHGVKMAYAAAAIVDAVVKLHRLIPVIPARLRTEAVVARGLGGHLAVRHLFHSRHVEAAYQPLAGDVVEIVLRAESLSTVVVLSEVADALGPGIRHIVAGDMVRHEVHHHLQPRAVSPVHQRLKLSHAPPGVGSQVGVDIIVVLHGIGRACTPLDHGTVVALNAAVGIVCLRGMLQQARKPYMAHSKRPDLTQRKHGEIPHQTAAVTLPAAVGHRVGHPVAKQTGQYLIDDNLLHSSAKLQKKSKIDK